MFARHLFFLLAFLGSPFYCMSQVAPTIPDAPGETATFLKVLSNPQKFNGKQVKLIGFLSHGFESSGLYFHKEDARNGILDNALWIDLPQMTPRQLLRLNKRYVIVVGTFDANHHGHMGLWQGALANVTQCHLLEERTRPKVKLQK